jgi:hypothetical protein
MASNKDSEPFSVRVMRYLDEQDDALAAARAVANDENASAEDRTQAIAELETIRDRLEHRAPTHIDRLLSFAVDPSADPAVQTMSRRFFIDLNWLREEDFVLQTKAELRERVVAIMKEQGRWPDGVD